MDTPGPGAAPRLVALVLAAGAGRRFAGPTPKLLAPLGSTTVVDAAVGSCLRAGIGPVVVVDGAVDLAGRWPAEEVTVVHHAGWRAGLAASLRAGIEAAGRRPGPGPDAVVVGLGDQPGVPPEAWSRVAAAGHRPVVTARFGEARRPPVRLAREVWPLLPAQGDEGARALMRDRPDLVGEVACPGEPADVDTIEDLRRWS